MSHEIDQVMEQAVARGVFSSASLLVGLKGEILHLGFYGAAREETLFDIASLTKPIATATLAMLLLEEERIKLTDPLPSWLSQAKQNVHKKITLTHLLSHTSGLPAWRPFYRALPVSQIGTTEGKDYIIAASLQEPIRSEPGSISEYGDLGYILLGEILEQAGGKPLDELFDEKIANPLGLKETFFLKVGEQSAGADDRNRFAPTEDCPWRRRVIQGEVHDPNAYAMGGIAGHAGLFSTTKEIHRFVTALMESYRGQSRWVDQKIVKSFIEPESLLLSHHGTHLLGWDTPTFGTSSAGRNFAPRSIGHLGYTGCSLWIDLEREFWVILFTNRIHPSVANEKIVSFRPRIHNLIWKTFCS